MVTTTKDEEQIKTQGLPPSSPPLWPQLRQSRPFSPSSHLVPATSHTPFSLPINGWCCSWCRLASVCASASNVMPLILLWAPSPNPAAPREPVRPAPRSVCTVCRSQHSKQRLNSLENQWTSAGLSTSSQPFPVEQKQNKTECEREQKKQESEQKVKEKVSGQIKDRNNWTIEQ